MRLEQYLNEDNNLEFYENIKKDCKKYLSDIKNSKYVFVRYETHGRTAYKKKVRKDRRPKDTPKMVHEMMDKSLKEKFGWNVRSEGLFVYGLSDNTHGGYLVFPVGDYKFVWSSKFADITNSLAKEIKSGPIRFKTNFDELEHMDILTTFWNEKCLDTYKDKNLKSAMISQNEISVKCDYAYLIKDTIENAKRMLFGEKK